MPEVTPPQSPVSDQDPSRNFPSLILFPEQPHLQLNFLHIFLLPSSRSSVRSLESHKSTALALISHRRSSLSSSSAAGTMGGPFASYSIKLPKPVLHLLSFLASISRAVSPPPPSQDRINPFLTASDNLLLPTAVSIKSKLPAAEFRRLAADSPPAACAVCLAAFEARDQVRELGNCSHVFHVACIDRWIDADGLTCPLCRSPLLQSPEEEEKAEDELLGNFFSTILRISRFVINTFAGL